MKELLDLLEQKGYEAKVVDDLFADSLDIKRYAAISVTKDGLTSALSVSRDISPESMEETVFWADFSFQKALEQKQGQQGQGVPQ